MILRRAIAYPGVAQLVGRLVWDQDAASSSLATRTMKNGCFREKTTVFWIFKGFLSLLSRHSLERIVLLFVFWGGEKVEQKIQPDGKSGKELPLFHVFVFAT